MVQGYIWLGENQPNDVDDNESENHGEKWLLGFDETLGDVYLKDCKVVMQDIKNVPST